MINKLSDLQTSSKTYWSILKALANVRKISVIPPLLINNKLMSNFKEKADKFNELFYLHCTPIDNESKCPTRLFFLLLMRTFY